MYRHGSFAQWLVMQTANEGVGAYVVEGLIRQRVEIDEIQCGFMSGRGTTKQYSLYISYSRSS